jgi:hypothetical protein
MDRPLNTSFHEHGRCDGIDKFRCIHGNAGTDVVAVNDSRPVPVVGTAHNLYRIFHRQPAERLPCRISAAAVGIGPWQMAAMILPKA